MSLDTKTVQAFVVKQDTMVFTDVTQVIIGLSLLHKAVKYSIWEGMAHTESRVSEQC